MGKHDTVSGMEVTARMYDDQGHDLLKERTWQILNNYNFDYGMRIAKGY